jgi:hypothetical protein
MLIHGRCHCGNISFALNWVPEPAEISARACTCTFCRGHGAVWTSCPTGSLTVTVVDPSRVSKYAFDTKTADFHICTTCGIVPVVTSLIDDHLYAVVNVNAFRDVEPLLLRRSSATLDNESEDVRLARRKRGWIAKVAYSILPEASVSASI